MGYQIELIGKRWETGDEFIEESPARNQNTKTEQEFHNKAESVELAFYLTSDEIARSQPNRLESSAFDEGLIKSFIFCTVELKDKDYPRGKYAEFTREVNKRFMLPVVVFFRVENRLTIGFVGRHPHTYDEDRDVLEKATLIKDIRLDNPHRAHLEALFELSLAECLTWMASKKQPKNFDGLLAAWLAQLDTEELNKKFYRELFAWFEWAVAEGKFPTDENRTLKPEEHVIRLITRLLFVWFIKEKGLVSDELFNETQVRDLLEDYDRDTGDSYYRAVLQNLFFATLNTEIEKREFSQGGNSIHRNFSLYRYEDQMRDPDTLLALFAQTPFINGGLFDCLDSFKAPRDGGYRIDCFSDKDYEKLSIPNRLFFDDSRGLIPLLEHYKFTVEENTPIEQEVALDPELLGKVFENLLAAYNPETGATVRKQTGSYYTPRAIVDYMVEEALVATLAGQVPPTDGDTELWKEELRYLFDYAQVCDDASEWFSDDETDGIVRAISELKILDPAVGSGAFPMGVLHKLTLALRRLDPDNSRWEQLQRDRAGKRAEAAFKISNQQERDVELAEISGTFERYRDSDFGRKLYLIRSSIFGVDIQPVACQIAKLRFFISLAIEQEPDGAADNFGIKPLPNLETRFVAANTLIALQLSEALPLLQDDAVQQLLEEIEGIRGKHFLTNNRQQKLDLEDQEDECRGRLKEELEIQRTKWMKNRKQEIKHKVNQLPNPEHREQLREVEQKKYEGRKKEFDSGFKDAHKIASWKPYDQNASADWFDSEWMFGINDGFDIVIGNPPYVRQEKIKELKPTLKDRYDCYTGTADLYVYFYERGFQMLRNNGVLTYISSNKYFRSAYGKKLRDFIARHATVSQLIDFGDAPVFTSIAYPSIITASKAHAQGNHLRALNWEPGPSIDEFGTVFQMKGFTMPQNALTADGWRLASPTVLNLLEKLRNAGKPLGEYVQGRFYMGIKTGLNKAFVVDKEIRDKLVAEHPSSSEVLKPFLRGQDVKRWQANFEEQYLITIESSENRAHPWSGQSPGEAEEMFANTYPAICAHFEPFREQLTNRYDQGKYFWELRTCAYWEEFEQAKIILRCFMNKATFAFDKEAFFHNNALHMIAGVNEYVVAILNSSVSWWFLCQICTDLQNGYLQAYQENLFQIPVPYANVEQQSTIIRFVDQIFDTKYVDSDADVSELENEIDQIVYSLYGLTVDEIDIVKETENV